MAILSSLIGGTMKIFKNTLYLFDSTIFEQGAYFPKIMFRKFSQNSDRKLHKKERLAL